MIYLILSAIDRYGRENGKTIAGPSEMFVREVVGDEPFTVTNDLSFWPPPGSKVVICGAPAMRSWYQTDSDLNTQRGYIRHARACECVATYLPIDCIDIVSHEHEGFGETDDEDEQETGNSKDSAPTSRQNYRFWFGADVKKLIKDERRTTVDNSSPVRIGDRNSLMALAGDWLFLDIETHPPTNTLQCFSFCGIEGPVWTVPVYDHRGQARCHLTEVICALVRAFQRLTVVGHNVSFDLGFLAHYHGIPWGRRIEDTMIQHHRTFPESEKSLGHVISYWINAPYHKDSAGSFTPYNEHQYQKLLRYNALDVATTRAVWLAQRAYSDSRCGLRASYSSANRSTEPYLRAGLTGFEFGEVARRKAQSALESQTKQLGRALNILVGHEILPTSSQQLGKYLYEEMHYPVKHRTESNAPSTAADALYDLLLLYPKNTALRVILGLRDLNKQLDMLGFKSYYRIDKR